MTGRCDGLFGACDLGSEDVFEFEKFVVFFFFFFFWGGGKIFVRTLWSLTKTKTQCSHCCAKKKGILVVTSLLRSHFRLFTQWEECCTMSLKTAV